MLYEIEDSNPGSRSRSTSPPVAVPSPPCPPFLAAAPAMRLSPPKIGLPARCVPILAARAAESRGG